MRLYRSLIAVLTAVALASLTRPALASHCGACLVRVDFTGSDLTGADFSCANLDGAIFDPGADPRS